MMSGIGLSGSDREESDSNRLWVSREPVLSNSDVEKFQTAFHISNIPIQCSYPRIY